MPELPEVETISRQLHVVLPGKIIESVNELQGQSCLSAGMALKLVGKKITAVGRKQKIIIIELDSDEVLLVHLKMTGQLIFLGKNKERVVGGHPTADWVGALPSKHTRVMISFDDGSWLFFNDQRKFGWIKLVDEKTWEQMKMSMPPDVVDVAFTRGYLGEILRKSSRAVKLLILDQDKVGGMGNIYANDALFLAKIHPKTPANQIKDRAVIMLHEAMRQVINTGIDTGGASYSHFVDSEGVGGHYQDHFLVYDQEGKRCKVCRALIHKIQLGGRGTYFCPQCQK